MAAGSTANLLFTIGADSTEGQAGLQQFRNILTGDLASMKNTFAGWAKGVAGDLDGVKAAMLGASAAGVAVIGLAGAMHSAAEKAAAYADEINDGMSKTGLAAEEISKLKFAAERAGVEYGSLVTSIVRFERATVEAAAGEKQYADAFRRLGISQAEVKQGTENILPLLLRTADAFKAQTSTTEKAASSLDLFSRGGADMLEFLSLGSEGIKNFMDRAEDLGLVLDETAIRAAKSFRIAQQELRAMREALDLEIGKIAIPIETNALILSRGLFETFKDVGAWHPFSPDFWKHLGDEIWKAHQQIQDATAAAFAAGGKDRLLPSGSDTGEKAKKSLKDFDGLSRILTQVRGELADFGTEEEQAAFQTEQLNAEIIKAHAKLTELHSAGEIGTATFAREAQALASLATALPGLADAQAKALADKRAEAAAKAAEEAAREKAALAEAEDARKEAFARELTDLQQHLASIVMARMTSQERLAWQYQEDLVAFSQVEESKSLALAATEAERQAIRQQYEINRQAALGFYEAGLTQLANSTGWQGVFGELFANQIRGDEELLRQWAESANQSMLMVRVAVQSTEETLQRAFGNFSRAMAQNITQAFIYKQSIGEAMRAAAASALQAIAAESIVQAIYSTAVGFLRIAHHDYPGAAAAFQAAALFGSVGAVAAVAGRAIAPQQAGAGASAGASGGSSGTGGAAGASGAAEGPRVVIYVQGPVVGASGIEELTDMINEAVQGRDVRLVATQVKQATRATQ